MLLKALVITPSIVVTLRKEGDTSIQDTDL
jgi:hypothetical protein